MRSSHTRASRVAKRLLEAIGYLELGMIGHARGCLIDIGEPGALAPAAKMIRDEAVKRDRRRMDEALPVELVRPRAPDPVGEEVLLALSRCFWEAGESAWAEEVFRYTQPIVRRFRQRRGQPGSKHKPAR
jgi:hypothetical protein